jgi:cell wall-associated NlpC family hydrolase
MNRAKHRAAGRASADTAVLATTLLERFATVPALPTDGEGDLFAVAPRPAPMLPVPRPDAERSPFGAGRHAVPARPRPVSVPGPRVVQSSPVPSGRTRPQPVGAALSVTVLGAAAAVTAIVAPPVAVESTGALAPVQGAAPAPAPGLAAADLAVAAPQALAAQPAMQVGELVTEVTGQMQRIGYKNVARSTAAASSPAAMRRAAMTNALGKLGKPYRWGAMGPNAFDCSGLVKWSFGSAGRALPRTSRAMATVGTPVRRADLQPGDLVFFYKPVSHVGIYIGNGKIVHASTSGQPVKISNVNAKTFSGARRV